MYAAKEVVQRKPKEGSGYNKRCNKKTPNPHESVHDGSASRVTRYGSPDRLKLCDNLFITDIAGDFLRHYLRYGPNPDIVYKTSVGALPYFLKIFEVDVDIDYNKFEKLSPNDAAFFTHDIRKKKIVKDFNFHKPTVFETILFLYCIYMNTSFHNGVDELSKGVHMRGKCSPRLVEFLETGMTNGTIDISSLEIEKDWGFTVDQLKLMKMAELFQRKEDYNFMTSDDSGYSFSQFLYQLFSPECTGEKRHIKTDWLRKEIEEIEEKIIQADEEKIIQADAEPKAADSASESDGESESEYEGEPANQRRRSSHTRNKSSSSATQELVVQQQQHDQLPAQGQFQVPIVPEAYVPNALPNHRNNTLIISEQSSAPEVIVLLSKRIQYYGGIDALLHKLLSLLMYYARTCNQNIMPNYYHNKVWVKYCFEIFDNLNEDQQNEASQYFVRNYMNEINHHSHIQYHNPVQHFKAITYTQIEQHNDIPTSFHNVPTEYQHMSPSSSHQINTQQETTASHFHGNDNGNDNNGETENDRENDNNNDNNNDKNNGNGNNDEIENDKLDNHERIDEQHQQKLPALTLDDLFGSDTNDNEEQTQTDDNDDGKKHQKKLMMDRNDNIEPLTTAAQLSTNTTLSEDTDDDSQKVHANKTTAKTTAKTIANTKTVHSSKKTKAAKNQITSSYNTRTKTKAASTEQLHEQPPTKITSRKRKASPTKKNASQQQNKQNKTKH